MLGTLAFLLHESRDDENSLQGVFVENSFLHSSHLVGKRCKITAIKQKNGQFKIFVTTAVGAVGAEYMRFKIGQF